MRYLPLLVISAALLGSALATVTQDLIEDLKTELQSLPKEGRDSSDRFKVQQLAGLLGKPELDETQTESLATLLEQFSVVAPSARIREIAKVLGPELKKDQAAREAAGVAEINKILGNALKTCLAAKTAKEMDEPYAAVSKLARDGQRMYRSTRFSQALQQASRVQNLLRSLQDFIAGTGSDGMRRQRLSSFLSNDFDLSDLIPRSDLLAKIKELENRVDPAGAETELSSEQLSRKTQEILAAAKTLDDLPGVIKAAEALRTSQRFSGSQSSLLEDLRSLNGTYLEIKRGQSSTINLTNTALRYGSGSGPLENMKTQLLLYVLPRLLMLPPSAAAKPEETPVSFLRKTLAGAQEKRDWLLVSRVIDTAQKLDVQIGTGAGDAQALRSFLAGYNQDRAQLYAQAVTSYLATLRTGSQIIPPEHVGELLAAIKKAHPEEYETTSKAYEEAYTRVQAGGAAAAATTISHSSEPPSRLTVPPADPTPKPEK